MMPFFTFYGGKQRASRRYPPPRHGIVIEPFAGAAGYSMQYWDRLVVLNDIDPVITGTWEYLRRSEPAEILALPDLHVGQSTDDLPVCQEARWLIGWWLNKGSSTPKRRPSSFMLNHPEGGPYWGPRIRERIAGQVHRIRHWTIVTGDYRDLPNVPATWFVDPPYSRAGRYYRHGSEGIRYPELATWCQRRIGQVVTCEADDAAWLPFRPLMQIDGTEGRQKTNRARLEVVWTGGAEHDRSSEAV